MLAFFHQTGESFVRANRTIREGELQKPVGLAIEKDLKIRQEFKTGIVPVDMADTANGPDVAVGFNAFKAVNSSTE
jgi:hypothetical protein